MKKGIIIVGICLFLSFASGVRITEVELNPEGVDSGAEWVEIYSEEEIDLRGYRIINNDGDELNLSGGFSGYFVYELEKQWLDNTDEKIFLYMVGELVDETEIFDDSKDDNKTWQDCTSWEFNESTKGKENFCGNGKTEKKEVEETEDKDDNEDLDEINKKDDVNNIEPKFEIKIENQKIEVNESTETIINLNPQSPKTEELIYESKNEKIKQYSIYGFSMLLILIIILMMRKIK